MPTTPWPAPVTLTGTLVALQPLAPTHAADLAEAAADGELHQLWYTSVPAQQGVPAEIERRLGLQAKGTMLPFAIIDTDSASGRAIRQATGGAVGQATGGAVGQASGRAVGMTTYMNIDATNRRLEIGSTWYRRAVQRSGLNTECKYLLLAHAFEALACNAVEFRTHIMNTQSRRAIERLGAKLDGILRQHMILPNGTLRDTCVYSIISPEWPTIKAHLEWQMAKPR